MSAPPRAATHADRLVRVHRADPAGLAPRFTLACVMAVLLAGPAGCSAADAICGAGEHPVMAVGSTGRACVPNGTKPPKGYAGYPKGKVPRHVDDRWDRYWRTHTVDGNGRIIRTPDAG